ncbi:MAG TPA: hypothetical protein ENJ79_06750 [Gammaproteobacteria bacterium]|nr:hypothetical protein [Gammaproteobacteria bacterium]
MAEQGLILSLVESPAHPNFSALYRRLGFAEIKVNSARKAIAELKKSRPDLLVAEFNYGYANNYAGVNVSNLDTLLASLRRYSPDTRTLVLVDHSERQYVDKLAALFPLRAVLVLPVTEQTMRAALEDAAR